MKRNGNLLLATAGALLLVALGTESAQAGGGLASGQVVHTATPQTFSYTTGQYYWSVVAVQPTASSAYDLYLDDAQNDFLGESAYGTGLTNFVAVDSNTGTRPFQTYDAEVTQYTAGSYWIEASYGTSEVTIPTPTHHGTTGFADPDIAYMNLNSNAVVSISDIYLTAGQSFWASTPVASSELFLLEANPAYSSTFVQTRATATIHQSAKVVDNCTLYTASVSGWHALVLIDDTPPVTTNPQQGIAFGLHRYDPSTPNYCPMADFPAATP